VTRDTPPDAPAQPPARRCELTPDPADPACAADSVLVWHGLYRGVAALLEPEPPDDQILEVPTDYGQEEAVACTLSPFEANSWRQPGGPNAIGPAFFNWFFRIRDVHCRQMTTPDVQVPSGVPRCRVLLWLQVSSAVARPRRSARPLCTSLSCSPRMSCRPCG
jgi:hypothetical protein